MVGATGKGKRRHGMTPISLILKNCLCEVSRAQSLKFITIRELVAERQGWAAIGEFIQ